MERNDEGYEEIGYTQALIEYCTEHKHNLRKVNIDQDKEVV